MRADEQIALLESLIQQRKETFTPNEILVFSPFGKNKTYRLLKSLVAKQRLHYEKPRDDKNRYVGALYHLSRDVARDMARDMDRDVDRYVGRDMAPGRGESVAAQRFQGSPSRTRACNIYFSSSFSSKKIKEKKEEKKEEKNLKRFPETVTRLEPENDRFHCERLIGRSLTESQREFVGKKLSEISAASLIDEVTHCLLDVDTFKGAGNAFLHKLRSILTVIQNGNWRRPKGMFINEFDENSVEMKRLCGVHVAELKVKINRLKCDMKVTQSALQSIHAERSEKYRDMMLQELSRIQNLYEQALNELKQKEMQ